MSLPRLCVGAALIAAFTIAGCSDGDSGKITAKGPQAASAAANRLDAADGASKHRMGEDDQLNWGPAPPIFPPGAQFAVVQGDPSVAGAIFTVRLRFPNGYILPPHRHPTDEHVTVLRGTFLVGIGEDFSENALVALKEDSFITAPANTAHFASARGMTEVQVHAIGPFQLTYVHPQDDPTT
ncbi:MAG TPA: cupin domain-containing protein [Gemmatimonadaceae bacterium]|jgi:quercetin dioxygenase-like cupin family protein